MKQSELQLPMQSLSLSDATDSATEAGVQSSPVPSVTVSNANNSPPQITISPDTPASSRSPVLRSESPVAPKKSNLEPTAAPYEATSNMYQMQQMMQMQSPYAADMSMGMVVMPPLQPPADGENAWTKTMPYVMPPYGAYMPQYAMQFPRPSAAPHMVPVGRTVYIGNIPPKTSASELLNMVKFGPVESLRMLPDKNCAFVSFLNAQVAAAFHADMTVKRVSLNDHELKIGWGKPSVTPPAVLMAVQNNNASRNVYIGGIDDDMTEDSIRLDLSHFGEIDQVKIIRETKVCFVHFLSIQSAMAVVSSLTLEPKWKGKRVNYGKDRCSYVPKGQQQIQAHNNQAAALGLAAATWLGYPTGYSGFSSNSPAGVAFSSFMAGNESGSASEPVAEQIHSNKVKNPDPQYHQFGNRTVYLGNLHPNTTTEEICNHVRGGILESIKYLPNRHIAFVTFIDHNTALTFYHLATYSGMTINGRRLRIGWGRPSGRLNPAIALAVQAGASRNLYLGNIDDPELLQEDRIRREFSVFGELEMVNTLREKNCAFANFTNIQSAIKCNEAMKHHKDYSKVKISFGKDRCGNLPRGLNRFHANWSSAKERANENG
ncbi:hypothetical protein MCUN1_001763 [Malassezia cuniculi]|uniref:RRM domain-containing protein n=1 Tax=Malassezia cuniculi TaxID=948313 RepID=A0AAF0J5X1_9BASI|nr:hypothetical protein MCUN1_001763 [Malassezia cuniculi]